jgi:hypothetical protein
MKKKQTKKVVSKKSVSKSVLSKDDQATTLVKIISVFEYVGAGFCIFFGLIFVFGGKLLQAILQNMPPAELAQVPAAVLGTAIAIMGVIMIVIGIFLVFLARALWAHKNWARIVFIVFSSIGVLAALLSLPSGILGLILHGAIVYFLAFNKDVIALFK